MKRYNSNKIGSVWVFQRKQKGNWYYSYNLGTKSILKSLETSHLGRATELVKKINSDIALGTEVHEVINKPKTLYEAFDQYINYLKSECRQPRTIVRYKGIYKIFVNFCANHKIEGIESLNQRLLNLYRMDRSDKIKESTRYYETERLVEFGSYLVVEGLLNKNPFSLGKISKATKEPFPWFTINDVEQILLQARKSDAEVFEVLAFTGMRIGELRRLQWSHIDFTRGVLTVASTSLNPTKGKYSRVIPMHARVIKVLNGLKNKTGLVFNAEISHQFPEGNRPIYKNGLLDRLKVICKNLNIDGCLHSFRKFFCSYMANQGVPVLTLKEWTGHKDIKVLIDSYYKLHEEDSVNFMKNVSDNQEVAKSEGQLRDKSKDIKEVLEIH